MAFALVAPLPGVVGDMQNGEGCSNYLPARLNLDNITFAVRFYILSYPGNYARDLAKFASQSESLHNSPPPW